MCGRATLTTPAEVLRALFELDAAPVFRPRYNIAPTQELAVIRVPHRLEWIRFGLVSAERVKGVRAINARSENLERVAAHREALKTRRCLVIVDGFFEWKKPAQGGRKHPYLIQRADKAPFALAGLWDQGEGGATGCAIITGQAAGVVAELHDRMPIVLGREAAAQWLEPRCERPRALLVPDASEWSAQRVSQAANNPANDTQDVLRPVDGPELGENLSLF